MYASTKAKEFGFNFLKYKMLFHKLSGQRILHCKFGEGDFPANTCDLHGIQLMNAQSLFVVTWIQPQLQS